MTDEEYRELRRFVLDRLIEFNIRSPLTVEKDHEVIDQAFSLLENTPENEKTLKSYSRFFDDKPGFKKEWAVEFQG